MKHLITAIIAVAMWLIPQTAHNESIKVPQETPVIVEEVIQEEAPENAIDILVDVIQDFEGFYAGSRAHKNNNPCNLRYSPFQDSKLAGFSFFNTYEAGREACVHQITIASDGRSRVYRPDMTLLEFFNKYAPASDSNQPSVYYAYVIKHTEFTAETRLKDLLK